MSHTPGPWSAVCRHVSYKGGEWPEDEFLQWEVEGPKAVMYGRGTFYQSDANLVAAAPELLAALKAFLDMYLSGANSGDWGNWDAEKDPEVIAARAAIAKAEGQS